MNQSMMVRVRLTRASTPKQKMIRVRPIGTGLTGSVREQAAQIISAIKMAMLDRDAREIAAVTGLRSGFIAALISELRAGKLS